MLLVKVPCYVKIALCDVMATGHVSTSDGGMHEQKRQDRRELAQNGHPQSYHAEKMRKGNESLCWYVPMVALR